MKNFFKILLVLILMSVILSSTFIFPIYYIYQSGKNFIEEIQQQTKSRALEIATALDTMSGESFYYDNFISLSSVLAKIVEINNQKKDPYKIEEIFLLGMNHDILAHNNIFKVAKDHQTKYDPKTYKLDRILFASNNIDLEIIGYSDIKLPLEIIKIDSWFPFFDLGEGLKHIIKKRIPNLLANEFHVYSSVYPPDQILPSASLHIHIKNYGIEPLITYWIQQMFYVLVLSFVIFIILFGFFTVILYNLIKKNKTIDKELIQLPYQISENKENLPEDELSLDAIDSNILEEELKEIDELKQDEEKSQNDNIQKDEGITSKSKVIFLKDFQKRREEDKIKQYINIEKDEFKKSLGNEKNSKRGLLNYENIIDALPLE